jgi:Flp pilus assembly protein protease CpaA
MTLELRAVLTGLLLTGLAVLLVLAALIDIRERRIPNWLTGTVAATYAVYVLVNPQSAWLGALAAASAVFLFGLVVFSRGLMGGGDVKLIAALTLWAGLDHLALFALVTCLAGGALALCSLWCQRWSGLIGAQMAAFGWNPVPATPAPRDPAAPADHAEANVLPSADQPPFTLPYGVAIAAGGLAVITQLLNL